MGTRRHRSVLAAAFALAAASFAANSARAGTISITNENFDSIGTAAAASLPSGWRVAKNTAISSGIFTPLTYTVANTVTERADGVDISSSTSTHGIYNFGSGDTDTGTDRAVGFLASGTGGALHGGTLYYAFDNTSADAIVSLDLAYDVEKYRNGSNSAGFAIQLFYSDTGFSWTTAGATFRTTFTGDLDNLGYATGPGATRSIPTTTLTLANPVAPGATFYLAWQYSPHNTTLASNAQALGIDNVVINATTADTAPAVPTPAAFPAALALLTPLLARRSRASLPTN